MHRIESMKMNCRMAIIVPFLLFCPAVLAAAPLDRWAILADDSVTQRGLVELLTVELGSLPDIELLERSNIALILGEQEISLLGQASEAAGRIRVGQLLQADAILLLTTSRENEKPLLRVTIIGCSSGTRLCTAVAPPPDSDIKNCVSSVAQTVKRTRAKFATGVRGLVCVLPFVSDNLSYRFDRLQLGLCRLLQEELLSVPGVAVIEVEEARAISTELQGRTQEIEAQSVPIILEGAYSVTQSTTNVPPMLAMTIHVRSKNVSEQLKCASLPLAEVESFFRDKIVAQVLQKLNMKATGLPVSHETQFERLNERATSLARLSAWHEAIGLREAALLIRSDDISLRKATIDEYLLAINNTRTGSGKDQEECRECIRLWRITREHLEYIIRNRMVTQVQACDLIQKWVQSLYVVRVNNSQMLKDCELEKKQCLVDSFPWVMALDHGSGFIQPWDTISSLFLKHLLVRLDGNLRDDGDLQSLQNLVSKFTPQERVKSQEWAYTLREAGNYSESAHATFCKALQASSNVSIAVTGRYASLCRRYSAVAGTKGVTPDLLQEAKDLQKALKDVGAFDFYMESATETTIAQINRDIATFHKPKQLEAGDGQTPLRPIALPKSTPPSIPAVIKRDKPELKLEEVLFRVKGMADGSDQPAVTTPCGVLDILNCGTFDVLWSESSLHLHTKRGELTCLLANSVALLEDVKWDGKYLWVGTRREGLWVYDQAGNLLIKVTDKNDLPSVAEYVWRVNDARGLLLCPVEKGKVLIAAQIKQNPRVSTSPVRSWCAMVTYREGRADVRVFHEARRTLAGGEGAKSLLFNPTMAFRPTWISEYREPKTNRRYVYIGRDFIDGMWPARRLPLRIDVDTLEVNVAESPPPGRPIDLPEPFAAHCDLLSSLPKNCPPVRWGISSILGVVAWPRYGGALKRVHLILPDTTSSTTGNGKPLASQKDLSESCGQGKP